MKTGLSTSVIIPVYNEKDYLERCLAALQDQTVPVDEIIVVDNNTNDGSVAAAKKMFKDVTFLDEKEQGIVFARNTGFDAAKGDILVKFDADTLAKPDWHQNLQDTIGDFDGWTGYGDTVELNKYVQPVVNVVFRFFTFRLNSAIAGAPFLFGCNLALRKDAWRTIKPKLHMRNDIWEDLDISLALKEAGLSATTSRHIGVSISARSANAPIGRFYKRTLGLPRVFRLHKMPVATALSCIELHIAFISWLLLKPPAFIGKTINRRPRPEQY